MTDIPVSTQAKLLARYLKDKGLARLSHSQALEALAHASNFKTYNVLAAQSTSDAKPYQPLRLRCPARSGRPHFCERRSKRVSPSPMPSAFSPNHAVQWSFSTFRAQKRNFRRKESLSSMIMPALASRMTGAPM